MLFNKLSNKYNILNMNMIYIKNINKDNEFEASTFINN